jgi:hypothetical protein
MIKRIFQDLDECILHTYVNSNPYDGQKYVEFYLTEDMHIYRTLIRPCAKELFEYYNSIVGKDNVYILTSATYEYACTLNKLGEFGLSEDHILAREHIQKQTISTAYGGEDTLPVSIADKNNILIDNLPHYYNKSKMGVIGITRDNYHQTIEYYGSNHEEQIFLEDIKEFIAARL